MTESERAKILALYESGMGIKRIRQLMAMTAEEFNKVIKELKDNGDLPKKVTGQEKVAQAYANGERDPYEIAKTYGLSLKTVKDYKWRSGIKIGKRPPRNYRHCDRTNAINADLELGNATVAEIAKKHGVSWTYVKKLKNKLIEDGQI